MIKAVLFDLDGTLLPMDQDVFTKAYFKALAKKLLPLGYEPQKLVRSMWNGMKAMSMNDGNQTNEAVFWKSFKEDYGDDVIKDKDTFDDFYRSEFQNVQSVCGVNADVKDAVRKIKSMGLRTITATLPVFPLYAIESRIRWAGLVPEDFEYITSYENSYHTKPNIAYYQDIAKIINCRPEECLMVGNNVDEDMIAENIGMNVFLVPDCLINENGKDISIYPRGDFKDLVKYIETIH